MITLQSLFKLFLIILFLVCFSAYIHAQAFTDESNNAGIVLEHDGDLHSDIMSIGTGAAWFDYDRDGDLDLYITMRLEANKLYQNEGDGTFTEIAGDMSVEDVTGDGAGVAVADFNNDGFLDIYLANGGPDRFYKNNSGTSFTDITAAAGFDLTDDSRGTSASWGDYDDDGFLDLYVSHHNKVAGATNWSKEDKLYHNEGDETFTDVTELLSDAGDNSGFGFIGGWTDYDKDGDLDIIVVNDCLAPSEIGTKVFENAGDTHPTLSWNFNEVSVAIGIDDCRNGMGLAVGDYDRNGWQDLYYSNVGDCVFFENNSALFSDVSDDAGVNDQTWPLFSWGTCYLDYDLDGWQDLFLVLGSHHYPSSEDPHHNMFYHNNANGLDFADVSETMAMDDTTRGRTAVVGDYDNDGDPDILLVNYGETIALKRNNNNNGNHYLKVQLTGTDSNRDGIGAFLKLTAADNSVQYFETRSGSSLGGGDCIDPIFGLGNNTMVSELEITWPSGNVQTLTNISVDQLIAVEENAPLPIELESFTVSLYEKDKVMLEWHTLSEFNNDHFEIEKSRDGANFIPFVEIKADINPEGEHFYHYIDEQPFEGVNYYRLKQVDFDGKYSYSMIRSVSLEFSNFNFSISPNPINQNELLIKYETDLQVLTFEIYDSKGALRHRKMMEDNRSGDFTMDISALPAGLYVIKMTADQEELTRKLVVY